MVAPGYDHGARLPKSERLSCAGLGWVEAQTRRAGRRANAHARRRWQRPFTGEFRSGMHVDG